MDRWRVEVEQNSNIGSQEYVDTRGRKLSLHFEALNKNQSKTMLSCLCALSDINLSDDPLKGKSRYDPHSDEVTEAEKGIQVPWATQAVHDGNPDLSTSRAPVFSHINGLPSGFCCL